jgi:phage portal protein BeeE
MFDDIVELQVKLMENQKRIAEEKAEAAAQAEAAAANQRNNNIITRRTASTTPLSRSKTIGELLSKGHSPSDIALHLGVPLSHVLERQTQLRSPTYERLLRKFLSTGELEYPNQYVSYSVFQR